MIKISHLDHLVLTVADPEKTVAFYRDYLGMEPVLFGEGRLALRFGDQKINLHKASAPLHPCAAKPVAGSADLCFQTSEKIAAVKEKLEKAGLTIEEGIVPRTGATGPLLSLYIRDPDGNLIEISEQVR